MFITFEGIDGCGKSTQVRKLQERIMTDLGREVVLVRDPGNTAISEAIRAILLDKTHHSMSYRTELLLYSAARAQLVDTHIRPALERGTIVISDRFIDSTTAYQGFGRGIDLADIDAANRVATGGLMPDSTLFLHISLEEAKLRCSEKTADRIESAGDDFFERVIRGYKHLAQAQAQRVHLIQAGQSVTTLHEEIWGILQPKMKHIIEQKH
jgi:dTMP kinase